MLGGLEALLGGAVVALVGVVVAYLRGKSAGRKQDQGKAAQRKIETRERMDDALDASHAGGAAWHDRLSETKR